MIKSQSSPAYRHRCDSACTARCKVLADTLQAQKQPGLLTLCLKYNLGVGDAGVAALCEGLFTNSVLKVRQYLNILSYHSRSSSSSLMISYALE